MRISDWSSDVCSSDLCLAGRVSAEGELEGSETVLFGYYKALLTFTAAGRYLEAERAARKIKRDFYKDGQFGGEQYSAATVGPIYRDSWLTWGAHIAGRYDMSVPAARAIARQLCGTTGGALAEGSARTIDRSEEHTSELQSLMRISYAVFCLKQKKHILLTETYRE